MRRCAFIVLSVFLVMLAVCRAESEALEATRTIMPNGLVLLHSENHALPVVMVTLIVKAGQMNEPVEKGGLANLTAEMLSEGTKSLSSREISEELDFIGASLEASAAHDFTKISLSILKKDVEKGFALCADLVMNPAFDPEEVARKKDRIKGFLKKMEEEPSFLAGRAFNESVFGTHPYGRQVEGSPESVGRIERDDLLSFHAATYLPNNAILAIAGDMTGEEAGSLAEKYFGNWAKGEMATLPLQKPVAGEMGHVIKIDKDLTQANIIAGTPGISRGDSDYYAFSVLSYILGGGGFSSRLMKSIREEKGLAYDVHSFLSAHRYGGVFQIGAQTKNETANTVINEIYKQVEQIRGSGVSAEEILDAQSYLTGSFKRRLDTNRKIADFLALVEFFGLGPDYVEKYPEYIYSVTREDIRRVAGKYLVPGKFVWVVVADQEKAEIGESPPSLPPLLQDHQIRSGEVDHPE